MEDVHTEVHYETGVLQLKSLKGRMPGELVPEKGGETSVCNSRAAYEALPEELKRKIDGMKTENTQG